MKLWRKAAAAFTFALMVVPVLAADDPGSSQSGMVKANWFGSLRVRPEYNDGLHDITTAPGYEDNVTYAAYRANLGARFDLDMNVALVVDLQAVGRLGEDNTPYRGTQTQNNLTSFESLNHKVNFFQAYFDAKKVFGSPVSLRVGRQTMTFGDEWLIGDLDFYAGTSFDGFRGDIDHKYGTLTGFYMKLAEIDSPENVANTNPNSTGARGNGYSDLYGAYSTFKINEKFRADAGIIYRNNHLPAMVEESAKQLFTEKRITYTGRLNYGANTGLFANLNLAWQRGNGINWDHTGYQDIDAKGWELTGGWKFEIEGNPNKVYARVASYGGDKAGTTKNESFDPLYQDFHGRYGMSDFWNGPAENDHFTIWGRPGHIGGQYGAYVLQIGFESKLPGGLALAGSFQNVRRDQKFFNGSEFESDRNLGTEASIWASYDYGKNLTLSVGFAQVYPGPSLTAELKTWDAQVGSNPTKRLFISSTVHF